MSESAHPRDDLVRAVFPGAEMRESVAGDESPGLGTLTGHFSVFDTWYEVDSLWEGRFMERIAPGAFADTIAEDRAQMRVTFNHGHDPSMGDKVLGAIDVLEEDSKGARYEVPLFPSVPPLLVDGLRAGVYGSSFRFSVSADQWDNEPKRTKHNPEALPERTITKTRVSEFGPVTFPANPKATAGVRSLTDEWRSSATPTPPVPAPMPAPLSPAPARKEIVPVTAPVETMEHQDPIDEYRDVAEMRAAIEARKSRLTEIDAEASGRELSADQQVEWDRTDGEIGRLQRRIDAQESRRARLGTLITTVPEAVIPADGGQVGRYAPPAIVKSWEPRTVSEIRSQSRTDGEFGSLLRDHAMRHVERIQNPIANKSGVAALIDYKDSADHELKRRIISTDDPAYIRAWQKYVRTGNTDTFTAEERAAALTVGVTTTGGFALPVVFDPTIIATGAWNLANPFRQVCRIETIVGATKWEALTADAIAAVYAAAPSDGVPPGEGGPTFGRPSLETHRAHAFVTVSYEMMQDRPDLAGELTTLFAEGKDNLEATQFAIGIGTTVLPQGMGLKDAYTRDDSDGAAVAVVDIGGLEATLPIRHRVNAHWFLSRAAIRAIQAWETVGGQLFNSTAGYPAVGNPRTDRGGNTGLTLLGYPVMETPAMPWTPATTDTTWGVLCDPRTYCIVDRTGMEVRVIPDILNGATPSFPTGEHGVYAFWRNTARVLNVDGGRQGAVQ